MAELTNSVVAVCDYLQKKIEVAAEGLGIEQVFYGDQERIAKSPTVCIEPDVTEKPLRAAGRQVIPEFVVYILCYHAEIANVAQNRRNADLLAEAVETLINADPQLGGLVVHGHISQSASGYSQKVNGLMRSNRLRYTATSRFQLPMSS